ncbi:hypothetical protein LCGC14_2609450, partial [marine sediment metagenome]
YRSRLLDVCQRNDVDLVIPQTTREVGVLGNSLTSFAEQGSRIMASPNAARVNSKASLIEVMEFSPSGLSVVFSVEGLRVAAELHGYPNRSVVVKPAYSSGSRGVRIVTPEPWNVERFLSEKPSGLECDLESLSDMLACGAFPELLVMEYLPGPEYSVDCFRGEHVQIAVPRIRTAMRDGISTDTTIVDEPEMARHALAIAEQLGLTGVYGVQFKANAEGVPCLLEVNPRVQGTMAASVLAGANVIWMGVREVLGEPVTEMPTVRVGTRCVRHWLVSEIGATV